VGLSEVVMVVMVVVELKGKSTNINH